MCSDKEKCLKLPWLPSYAWVKSVCPITLSTINLWLLWTPLCHNTKSSFRRACRIICRCCGLLAQVAFWYNGQTCQALKNKTVKDIMFSGSTRGSDLNGNGNRRVGVFSGPPLIWAAGVSDSCLRRKVVTGSTGKHAPRNIFPFEIYKTIKPLH